MSIKNTHQSKTHTNRVKELKCKLKFNGEHSEHDAVLDDLNFEVRKLRQQIPVHDILRVEVYSDKAVCFISDGSSFDIWANDLKSLIENIIDGWERYFPSYDFRSESVSVSNEDTHGLVNYEMGIRETEASKMVTCSEEYLKRRGIKPPVIGGQIYELFKHREHRALCIREFAKHFSESVLSSVVMPLLSIPFFTILDLSGSKFDDAFLHLCSIGLRVNKELRALILKDCQLNYDQISVLLKSIPSNSPLRKLDLSGAVIAKEMRPNKWFRNLHHSICQRLTDLRLNRLILPLSEVFSHLKLCCSDGSLSLRRFEYQCILKSASLKDFLSLSPHLRVLTLDNGEISLSEVCSTLNEKECFGLEKLSLRSCNFGKTNDSIEKCFSNLRYIQQLNLQGCSGENSDEVIEFLRGSIAPGKHVLCLRTLNIKHFLEVLKGLSKNLKPNKFLQVQLNDCKLDQRAAQVIAKLLPLATRVISIHLANNPFGKDFHGVIKCLMQCPHLAHIEIGYREKTSISESGLLSTLLQTLVDKKCNLSRLTLNRLGSNKELVRFLDAVTSRVNPLKYLDIRDYALDDDEALGLIQLLRYTPSPFTFIFNTSNLKPGTIRLINCLIKRRWPMIRVQVPNYIYVAHNDQVVIVTCKSGSSKGAIDSVPIFPDDQLLMELGKFDDAILTPSDEVCNATLTLGRVAAKLAHAMPSQTDKLEPVVSKIHQANLDLYENLRLPAMHLDLLHNAVSQDACDAAVERAMKCLQVALERVLETSYETMVGSMKEVMYTSFTKSSASVINIGTELPQNIRDGVSAILDQRLKNTIRSMILDMNVALAERMVTKVAEDLDVDMENCLVNFPTRNMLTAKLTKSKPAIQASNDFV